MNVNDQLVLEKEITKKLKTEIAELEAEVKRVTEQSVSRCNENIEHWIIRKSVADELKEVIKPILLFHPNTSRKIEDQIERLRGKP